MAQQKTLKPPRFRQFLYPPTVVAEFLKGSKMGFPKDRDPLLYLHVESVKAGALRHEHASTYVCEQQMQYPGKQYISAAFAVHIKILPEGFDDTPSALVELRRQSSRLASLSGSTHAVAQGHADQTEPDIFG